MRAPAVLLAVAVCLAAATAAADTPANRARATLNDCLKAIPLDTLSDEGPIADCLAEAQRAAEAEDRRRGQVEFQRDLDRMDRMIERTRRGGRFP
jgi:hypothetical protein